MDKTNWLDFNTDTVPTARSHPPRFDVDDIKRHTVDRLPAVLRYLFPAGQQQGHLFRVGDLRGTPGKSLVVELEGPYAGLWKDFATGESGDIIDAWAAVFRMDPKREFTSVMASMTQWLGLPQTNASPQAHSKNPHRVRLPHRQLRLDELGPPTAKWDYLDRNGRLVACVYRHDTPSGKEFRPWDVKARALRAPTPRPLYNQPHLVTATHVVLVEGEKAADTLTRAGIIATTAMNGANAPVDKTDWSPLENKHVVIWPDHDAAGQAYALKAADRIVQSGARSVSILTIPSDKPEKWDAYDAAEEGIDLSAFIENGNHTVIRPSTAIPFFSIGELMADTSPMPDDLIQPRVLTPGGMIVFGGAPKVGKSDFLLSWLTHMAAGEPFLDLVPSKPLRVFYLQAEVQYHYLRERIHSMALSASLGQKAADNLYVTPQLRLVLNEHGVQHVISALQNVISDGGIDVLVIDPIRNVFDGGHEGSGENDNNAMLFFLRERVEQLRDAVNPEAGIILAHHTKKISKKQIEEDPFLSLSGAGSLRGYYTTGMLLYRPDESRTERTLVFELRNGPALPPKHVDKRDGQWAALDPLDDRLLDQNYGAKLDAERTRKRDVIVQILFDEAAQGRVYTANQFAEAFEGQFGLGAHRTINDRLSVLATQGHIQYFQDPKKYGLPALSRSKFGYLCVENMVVPCPDTNDAHPKHISTDWLSIQPTHFKCAQSGSLRLVVNPIRWGPQEASLNGISAHRVRE